MGPRAWNFSSALYYRGFTRFRLFRCDVGERIRARGRGKGRKIAAPCNIDFRDEYRRPWCLVAGTNALAAELVFQIRNFRATTWTLLKISSSLFPRYYNAYLFISLSLSLTLFLFCVGKENWKTRRKILYTGIVCRYVSRGILKGWIWRCTVCRWMCISSRD